MKKNRKKIAGLLATGLLLSAIGLAKTNVVHADNIVRHEGEWITYTANNWVKGHQESKRLQDVWGYWTINGQVVWCMEPAVPMPNNDDGRPTYDNGTDVIKANSTIQVRSFNHTRNVDGTHLRGVAGVQWLVYNASQQELNDLKSYFESANDKYGVDTVRMAEQMRGWSRNKKWTAMQLMIWHMVSATVVNNVQGVRGPLSTDIFDAANDINGYENMTGQYKYWVGKNRYLNDTLLGSNNGGSTGLNGTWTMRTVYDQMFQALNRATDAGILKYENGFKTYASHTGDQRQFGGGGDFSVTVDGYLKATKEFSNLKQDLNTKPSWDPNGIKVGVYRDVNATDKVGELTIGANCQSNTLKVKPGTYYGFELTPNGEPIKSSAMSVVSDKSANRGYVSGSDKKDTKKPYVTWTVTTGNNTSKPATETFVNTPEVVNFTFNKEIKANSVKSLEELDPQYTRAGAVYTLYKDAAAKEPVTRNGQPVTATIGQDGHAQFSDLYRGVYYVKETAVPTVVRNGRTFKRFALDKKVYTVDLTKMSDNETSTGDATVTVTKEFTKQGAFKSLEDTIPNNGSLVIKKKDKDSQSNKAQGQGTLHGAEFKVEFFEMITLGTANPVKKWEAVYKTDAKGEIDVRNRALMVSTTNTDAMNKLFTAYEQAKVWGAYDYRVSEVKAPNGYKLDGTSKTFVVKNGNTDFATSWEYDDASFLNDDLELELYKRQRTSGDWQVDTKVSVPNASFKLTNKTTGWTQTVKTDANGKLVYHGVAAGDYTLQEVAAEDYQTNGQIIDLKVEQKDGTTKLTAQSTSKVTDRNGGYEVGVQADGDINVTFDNTPNESKAKLIKANEKGARLEGAKFKLIDWGEDGKLKGKEVELTTNDKGELDWSELVVGHWYSVEETQAPKGYKLPADRMTLNFRVESVPAKNKFEVSYWTSTVNKRSESNVVKDASQVKKLTKANEMQDGVKFMTVDTDKNGKQDRVDLEFDFVNNTWQKLPATGSFVGPIAGAIVLTIIVGSTVFYFKKREA